MICSLTAAYLHLTCEFVLDKRFDVDASPGFACSPFIANPHKITFGHRRSLNEKIYNFSMR